jgi:putative heme-binding domain-containing protein
MLESMGDLFRPVLVLTGDDRDGAETDISLEGPFTVETWIRLDPGIGNSDGLLGAPGTFDLNFYDAKFRLYLGVKGGDAIIAKKSMTPDAWTHVALTRDEKGRFKIYINGELDNDQSRADTQKYEHLKLGVTSANGGTGAAMTEYRIWNTCRTAGEIRANFDRSLESPGIPGLVTRFSNTSWPKLSGKARIARTTDFPTLATPEQGKALDEKFAKFRALAEKTGDATKGQLYAAVCMGCHQIKGVGGMIGPNLSGIGAMGTDAILRNVLTPNAAMEAGYRVYQIVLKDGSIKEGFLAQEDANAVILRTPGAEDQRFSKADVRKAQFLKRSLMPEGLMEGFTPEMVTDLMTYLLSVK